MPRLLSGPISREPKTLVVDHMVTLLTLNFRYFSSCKMHKKRRHHKLLPFGIYLSCSWVPYSLFKSPTFNYCPSARLEPTSPCWDTQKYRHIFISRLDHEKTNSSFFHALGRHLALNDEHIFIYARELNCQFKRAKATAQYSIGVMPSRSVCCSIALTWFLVLLAHEHSQEAQDEDFAHLSEFSLRCC